MPLRTRLILLLVVLGAAALFVTDAITYNSLRSSLISQTDQGLQQSAASLNRVIIGVFHGETDPNACDGIQLHTFGVAYLTMKTPTPSPVITVTCLAGNTSTTPNKTYAPSIPAATVAAAYSGNRMIFTSIDGRGRNYRVLVEPGSDVGLPFPVLAFGVPITGVDATLSHHLRVDLVVSLLVLLALVIAAWALVRLGLRPLDKMAQTAGEIAAGDLSRRIEDTDERTEVGQLGAALNVMLTQIERAFREREASEERLRRFIGDASHELRTPLTSIRGYAELFKSGVAERPEDLAAALRRIESESSRMGGLVDDLLLLARLDQGRPLGHDLVDLTQLAADAVQDANIVDPSRSIRMASTGPCVVIGDEQRLRQVLGNLITNAVAYSPPGSPIEVAVHMDRAPAAGSVPAGLTGLPGLPALSGRAGRSGRTVRPLGAETARAGSPEGARPLGSEDLAVQPTRSLGAESPADGGPENPGSVGIELAAGGLDSRGWTEGNGAGTSPPDVAPWPGTRASVAVIDHGPGIPEESRPYVFERFWRADPSRRRASGGTGLGLAIVAAVVTAHGGDVSIRETPGGGATFVVGLPAAPEVSNGAGSGEGVPE